MVDKELEKRLKKVSEKAVKLGKDIIKELGPYCKGVCINTITGWREGDRHVVFSISITDSEEICLLYTSPSPRDLSTSRMPSSA